MNEEFHLLDPVGHDHVFLSGGEERSEKRTLLVVFLAAAAMVAEIVGGFVYGSMALLADGWHMASHVAALGLAFFGYRYARRHRASRRYSFGTGKVGPLTGYTSAVVLGIVGGLMAAESLHRLVEPVEVDFGPALVVAVIGLVVNLASAWLLEARQQHGHEHHHASHHHHHHDHNLRAAYLHVLADALTSFLALVALSAGLFYGIAWLDPAIGMVGAAVILVWAIGLMRAASRVLLDEEACSTMADDIRERLEQGTGDKVVDFHLWQIGAGHLALIVSVVTSRPRHPQYYKTQLQDFERLSHVTVEVFPSRQQAAEPSQVRATSRG